MIAARPVSAEVCGAATVGVVETGGVVETRGVMKTAGVVKAGGVEETGVSGTKPVPLNPGIALTDMYFVPVRTS